MSTESIPMEHIVKDNKDLSNMFSVLRLLGVSATINLSDKGLSSDINYIDKEGNTLSNHIDEDGKSTFTSKGYMNNEEYILNDR